MMYNFTLRSKLTALSLFFVFCLNAQWSADPYENNPIATKADRENACQIASDGSGGAIIAWWNYNKSDNDYDIYAQRIGADGVLKWAAGGIPICDLPSDTHVPYIISDGNGGAIIAWFDARNNGKNEIFLQKINGSGAVQWTANGVSVGTVADHYQHGSPSLTTDGAGGAIVAWEDWRVVDNSNIRAVYAQRISSSGIIQWGTGGIQVTNQSPSGVSISSDNNGGAIIAWTYATSTINDIYIQRINPSGSQLWTVNGVPICTLATYEVHPKSVSDISGGAIVIWEDMRSNSKTNIYAQKINSSGVVQWTVNGLPAIYNTSYTYRDHSIVSDGSGGAYIAAKNANNNVAIVQRINSSGAPQWNPDGIGISGCNEEPKLINTGVTGMVVTWSKDNGLGDIYAQKFNQAGEVQWGSGVGVSTPQFSEQFSPEIASGTNGEVLIAWDDYRNTLTALTDVYAQRVSVNGMLGMPTGMNDIEGDSMADFVLDQNHPNPFTDVTEIKFTIKKHGYVSLKAYGIDGRVISTLVDDTMEPGNYSVRFNSQNMPKGFIYYQMRSLNESCTKYMLHVK